MRNKVMAFKSECQTCYFYDDASIARSGWCQHPDRKTSPGFKILVRGQELACRNEFGQDLWESTLERLGPSVMRLKRDTLVHDRERDPRTNVVSTMPIKVREGAHLNPKINIIPTRKLQVFLCHGRDDRPIVRDLYQQLVGSSVKPWFDEEDLLAGQDWEWEIPRAVRRSDVVIACLSRTSVGKTGYVQKEIRLALDAADQQPEGAIFLIPLRLEECDVPERLRRYQWVDLFTSDGFARLMKSLSARTVALGLTTATVPSIFHS